MVFTVRCFKCGDKDVRLIMGGRSIIHARCHSCEANLLAEVMEFEQEVSELDVNQPPPDDPATLSNVPTVEKESESTIEEDTSPVQQA